MADPKDYSTLVRRNLLLESCEHKVNAGFKILAGSRSQMNDESGDEVICCRPPGGILENYLQESEQSLRANNHVPRKILQNEVISFQETDQRILSG